MKNITITVKKILNEIYAGEDKPGYWLPNIQRRFVWDEDQICRLFDSIMRKYPISTLLVWETRGSVKSRRFIDNYKDDLELAATSATIQPNRLKYMVLDGQQRLQSLFIGLKGSYNKKELHLNLLSGEPSSAKDIKYIFEFKDPKTAKWPYVNFKEIIYHTGGRVSDIAKDLTGKYKPQDLEISTSSQDTILHNIEDSRDRFNTKEILIYQLLEEDVDGYELDDIVEIFIRANSGGTKLSKSDLLFSLLIAGWEDVDEKMENLLRALNEGGFEFERDFILKACLTILNLGARYEVKKFYDEHTKKEIQDNWWKIDSSIKAVKDFLGTYTFIRHDKAIPSYLSLIPLIYLHYHLQEKFKANTESIKTYILQTLIAGSFSGSPDSLIDNIVSNIRHERDFNWGSIYKTIQENQNRSLSISKETLFREGYSSKGIHLIFNILYKNFDYTPSYNQNKPQVDHIFPQKILKDAGIIKSNRDQLANCMLLSADENGAANKSATPPEEWFSENRFDSRESQQKYLEKHLIPSDPELWKVHNFFSFIEERKKLIANKLSFMLLKDD